MKVNSGKAHFYLYFILILKFYSFLRKPLKKYFYINFHSSLKCDLYLNYLYYDLRDSLHLARFSFSC